MPKAAGPQSLRRLLDAVLSVSSGLDLTTVLQNIVESAIDLVDARYGALGVLDPSRTFLSEFITVGLDDEERAAIGEPPHGHGILGLLIVDPRRLRLSNLGEHPDSHGFPPGHPPMTSFLGVPIQLHDRVFGNLYLTDKTTGEVFTDVDEELVVGLAAAAAIAIDNARLHAKVQDLAVLEDRERIARDLHDTVIQRLFASGLSLQGIARLVQDDRVSSKLAAAVEDLDVTVREIRTAIFGLEDTHRAPDSLRARVLALSRDARPGLGLDPRIRFDGPVDNAVGEATAIELLAVLREALSNVARHADAHEVRITVAVDDVVTLTVSDDGRGMDLREPNAPGRGLQNMLARAQLLGGRLEVAAGASGRGTVVRWFVPTGAEPSIYPSGIVAPD